MPPLLPPSTLPYLTKSLVRTALTCPRKLVYAADPASYPRFRGSDPFARHLAEEGHRFGAHCRSLFPRGVDLSLRTEGVGADGTTTAAKNQDDCGEGGSCEWKGGGSSSGTDELVRRTSRMIRGGADGGGGEVTIFEGGIRHGSLFARPDILDLIVRPGDAADEGGDDGAADASAGAELRLIEVKSKSWDSRRSVGAEAMWTKRRRDGRRSVRSAYLPLVQDVAYQTLVARRAFPDLRVSSWLMMADRAKKRSVTASEKSGIPQIWNRIVDDDGLRSDGGAMGNGVGDDAIASGGLAVLVNVDDLVDAVLETNFPGSSKKDESFVDAVDRWAEQVTTKTTMTDGLSMPPIGSHCTSCEYRPLTGQGSGGFHICWQAVSGLDVETLCDEPTVADLYGRTKKAVDKFISMNKFLLSNLSADDLKVDEEEMGSSNSCSDSSRGSTFPAKKISRPFRQWLQVRSAIANHEDRRPKYVLARESLRREMDRWEYPLHFVDFETASPVLPYSEGKAPYDVLAFQFSVHKMVRQPSSGEVIVVHAAEFLCAEPGVCPNASFADALADALVGAGTVFRWSAHENTVLSSLLSSLSPSSSSSRAIEALLPLLDGGSRAMVDLRKIANDYYYTEGSGGSSSIKSLLAPTLSASNQLRQLYETPSYCGINFANAQWWQDDGSGRAIDPYEILSNESVNVKESDGIHEAIIDGGAATAAYHRLQCDDSLGNRDSSELKASLLRYCELDTLAMVMIVQAWQGFLEEDT